MFERVFKKRDGLISATILIITRVIFTWQSTNDNIKERFSKFFSGFDSTIKIARVHLLDAPSII